MAQILVYLALCQNCWIVVPKYYTFYSFVYLTSQLLVEGFKFSAMSIGLFLLFCKILLQVFCSSVITCMLIYDCIIFLMH
jgi:hypothetical protein